MDTVVVHTCCSALAGTRGTGAPCTPRGGAQCSRDGTCSTPDTTPHHITPHNATHTAKPDDKSTRTGVRGARLKKTATTHNTTRRAPSDDNVRRRGRARLRRGWEKRFRIACKITRNGDHHFRLPGTSQLTAHSSQLTSTSRKNCSRPCSPVSSSFFTATGRPIILPRYTLGWCRCVIFGRGGHGGFFSPRCCRCHLVLHECREHKGDWPYIWTTVPRLSQEPQGALSQMRTRHAHKRCVYLQCCCASFAFVLRYCNFPSKQRPRLLHDSKTKRPPHPHPDPRHRFRPASTPNSTLIHRSPK